MNGPTFESTYTFRGSELQSLLQLLQRASRNAELAEAEFDVYGREALQKEQDDIQNLLVKLRNIRHEVED